MTVGREIHALERNRTRATGRVSQIVDWLLAASLLLVGTGCTFSRRDVVPQSVPSALKIGLVAPFERRYRTLGYEVLHAVKWAVRQRNEQGGVAGTMVELVALDDSGQISQAQKFAIDTDVMGVVGPFTQEMLSASAADYDRLGLVALTPALCSASEADLESVFCQGGRVEDTAQAIAEHLPADGRVMLLSDEAGVLGDALSPFVQETVEVAGWQFPNGLPDLYIYDGEVLGAAETLLQMWSAGVDTPLWGGPSLARTQLAQIAQDAASGACYVMAAPTFADLSADSEFVAGYRSLAGTDPGPWAVLAYDAAMLLLDAIERSIEEDGVATRAGVKGQLVEAQTPDGQRTFQQGVRRQASYTWYCYDESEPYPGHVVETPWK